MESHVRHLSQETSHPLLFSLVPMLWYKQTVCTSANLPSREFGIMCLMHKLSNILSTSPAQLHTSQKYIDGAAKGTSGQGVIDPH